MRRAGGGGAAAGGPDRGALAARPGGGGPRGPAGSGAGVSGRPPAVRLRSSPSGGGGRAGEDLARRGRAQLGEAAAAGRERLPAEGGRGGSSAFLRSPGRVRRGRRCSRRGPRAAVGLGPVAAPRGCSGGGGRPRSPPLRPPTPLPGGSPAPLAASERPPGCPVWPFTGGSAMAAVPVPARRPCPLGFGLLGLGSLAFCSRA